MVRVAENEVVTPVQTLDYAPPVAAPSRRDVIWGVMISVFLANGVGWVAFGFLMMLGQRDDHAGPIAVGFASMTLALGLAATLFWTRRFPRNGE